MATADHTSGYEHLTLERRLDFAIEMVQEREKDERLFALVSSIEQLLRPCEGGISPDLSAWRLAELYEEVASDVGQINRLEDLLCTMRTAVAGISA